jgi:hypothetical protein
LKCQTPKDVLFATLAAARSAYVAADEIADYGDFAG